VVATTRVDLLEALKQLRPELAEALALRDVVGLSCAEIATLHHVAEGTVKSRLHHARREVRKRLTA
jgi:DNA-directed RNA polymerase specialized sigma24 family protein